MRHGNLYAWGLVLFIGLKGIEAQERVWQTREDFDSMFLDAVRPGDNRLVLQDYGRLIRRYDRDSQPAIGILIRNNIQDIPASVWHDSETDEIYVAMGGGSGLTILNPWTGHSVTYRNNGIWDTTDGPEGVLLREDWQFTTPLTLQFQKDATGDLERNYARARWFDTPLFTDVFRLKGTQDIMLTSPGTPGFYVIRTHDPATYADDECDEELARTLGLHLGFREVSKHFAFQDEEGYIYADDTHGQGFGVIHPDLQTLTRYSWDGVRVTPPIGEKKFVHYSSPKLTSFMFMKPLLKSRSGDLYVGSVGFELLPLGTFFVGRSGTIRTGTGMTILQDFDPESQRYMKSLNYRMTGLWDTTEEVGLVWKDRIWSVGYYNVFDETSETHLISRDERLPGGNVYHAREDDHGVVYVGTNMGLVLLYPDGHVQSVPEFAGDRIFSTFGTPLGDVYLNTGRGIESYQGIKAWHRDGTTSWLRPWRSAYPPVVPGGYERVEQLPMWLDRAQNLNVAIPGEGVEVYAPYRHGTATSFPVDVSEFSHPRLRWQADPAVTVQTRTGPLKAVYVDNFEDEDKGVLTLYAERVPQFQTDQWFQRYGRAGIKAVGWVPLSRSFPARSRVWVRVRVRGVAGQEAFRLSLVLQDEAGQVSFPTDRLVWEGETEAVVLEGQAEQGFAVLGVGVWPSSWLDIESLAVVSSEGWNAWQSLPHAEGSPIPQVDGEHPLVQWRAMFEREDLETALPSLSGVWLEEGPVTAVAEETAVRPRQSRLEPNYPNPFNAGTTIPFQVGGMAGSSAWVRLRLYNLHGQVVRRLVEGTYEPGVYQVRWEGRDEGGEEVGSGVYLYRLQVEDRPFVRRLLLLR